MKSFFRGLVIQIVAIIAAISGLITIVCLVGLILNIDSDIIYVLLASVTILSASIVFLRSKKITWEEFLACIWPSFGPW